MQALPHRYRVKGAGRITGDVELAADRLTMLPSSPPADFGGPGASRVSWISLDCDVTGTLDRGIVSMVEIPFSG